MSDEGQAAPGLNHSNASKQSPISHARDLGTTSPQALSVERGKQWKKLAEQGGSLATLARKFRCSKSHVRDLIMLASLPRDLQQAYVQGRLGRKKVLALARAHTKQVQITDETSSELQEQPQQNSDLIMSESERQAYIAQHAKLVVDWLRSTTLSPCDWEAFFRQIDLALYGPYPLLFAENAPRHTKISPEEDPWQVIRRCKPQLGTEVSLPDVINKHIDWLARWIQIVVPDRELMKETLGTAETVLVREAQ